MSSRPPPDAYWTPGPIPPGWRCPYCKDKKCRAYDRTEQTLGDKDQTCAMGWGWKRQARKTQIRELLACKRRMKGKT